MPDEASQLLDLPTQRPKRRRRSPTTLVQTAEDAALRIEETIAQLQRALVDIRVAIHLSNSRNDDDDG